MPQPTRRDFVGSSVAAGVVVATLPLTRVLAGKPPDVVDVQGSDPHKMVSAALTTLGGMNRFVKKGDYVVLKPNAAFANPPDWGSTTHPETVVAVAKACVVAGAKRITLVEFPGGKTSECLERCGMTAAFAEMPEVTLKLLAGKRDFKKTKIKGGVATQTTDIAKLVLSADVLINIPAAKHHSGTGVSLGLKNAMGLIYDRKSFHTQFDLHQGIADLGRVIRPQLTIVDATRALLTNGPAGPGDTAVPGRLIAGANVVSVDAVGLTVAKFGNRNMTPDDAPHIKLAAAAGLGEADISKLRIKKVKV